MEYKIHPIGYFESCFRQKTGTPRQAQLIKGAVGKLKVEIGNNPSFFITGLEEFSHVWLLFIFHKNYHLQNTIQDRNKFLKTKIKPPRLKGKKVGIFSSRSPYRPNPVGFSIAKLEKIETTKKGECILHFSGCDLIQGTPIIDIKPYIPEYDIIKDATTPDWIQENNFNEKIKITFTKQFDEQISILESKLEYFKTKEEIKKVIVEMIKLEPRSKYRELRSNEEVFGFFLDVVNIRCVFITPEDCHIFEIELQTKTNSFTKEKLKIRNVEDAKEFCKNLNIKNKKK